jgi:peroxiredoxin
VESTQKILEPGDQAPDFDLRGADGERYRLSVALPAGPVLVTFFQQECFACEISYLHWDAAYEAQVGDDFQLWAISLDSERDSVKFWDKSGVSFPVLVDDGCGIDSYRLVCTPAHFLIGTEGTVIASYDAFDRAAWNAMLSEVERLTGRPVEPFGTDDGPEFRAGCALHS